MALSIVLFGAGGVVVLPLAGALVAMARHGSVEAAGIEFPVVLLLKSLAYAGLVAIGAGGIGWVSARLVMRDGGGGWRALPFLVVPLLLPPTLISSGLGTLRAPGTALGNLIERTAQDGAGWLPGFVSQVLAIVGLAVWASPIVAGCCALGLGSMPRGVREDLQIDGAGWARREWELVRACGGMLGLGMVAVGAMMLGTTIPLHLAQVPTLALTIWAGLVLKPGDADVWVRAWPLFALAVVVAGVVVRRVSRAMSERGEFSPVGTGRGVPRVVWGWILGVVVVPIGLFAFSMRSWESGVRAVENFWPLSGDAVGSSLMVAGWVGLVTGLVGWGVWYLLFGLRRLPGWLAVVSLMVCVGGLVPGVLVGLAWTHVVQVVRPVWEGVQDWAGVVVLAHLTRFVWIGVIAGLGFAVAEARGVRRELAVVDGVGGLMAWIQAVSARRVLGLVGVGMAAGACSLHEIEATVVIQPAGLESLAQTVLGYLHFARMEDLAAAVIWLGGAGLLVAGAAAWLVGRVVGEGEQTGALASTGMGAELGSRAGGGAKPKSGESVE